jgi:hypothetical protein
LGAALAFFAALGFAAAFFLGAAFFLTTYQVWDVGCRVEGTGCGVSKQEFKVHRVHRAGSRVSV